MLNSVAFIPAVIALGTAQYLANVVTVNTQIAGAVVCLVAAAVAILRIRTNAVITGIFLVIELLALLVLTVLGILNFHPDRVGQLFSGWVVGNSSGGLDPVAFGVILTATASAVFAYNGYSNAVNFSEETKGSSRNIATAILLSLVITVAAELIPTTAVLLGAPDLAAITASSQPMIDFIDATANKTVDTIVSLGVALAIFNATLAIILEFGRILYSASRDRAWPGVINDWLVSVHPTLKSPWIATALVGIVSAHPVPDGRPEHAHHAHRRRARCRLRVRRHRRAVGRYTGATAASPYRMPLWPLPPLLALAALIYITTQQTHHGAPRRRRHDPHRAHLLGDRDPPPEGPRLESQGTASRRAGGRLTVGEHESWLRTPGGKPRARSLGHPVRGAARQLERDHRCPRRRGRLRDADRRGRRPNRRDARSIRAAARTPAIRAPLATTRRTAMAR